MDVSPTQEIAVLHVDDDPSILDLTSTFLEREDDAFVVSNGTDAEAALSTVCEGEIDCVVSDYEMPDLDGLEFLELVRDEFPDLPFVLFTGKGSEEIASEAISAGVDDYLQKGAGTDQYAVLANRIRTLVEGRRAETAVRRTEERYHNLVDTAPVPIMLFEPSKELTFANDAAVEYLHADSETELTGKPFTEFLHPEDQVRSEERFRRLMEERTAVPAVSYQVRTVDNVTKHATVATAPGYYQGTPVAQAIVQQETPAPQR